jgi:hypothetical protein
MRTNGQQVRLWWMSETVMVIRKLLVARVLPVLSQSIDCSLCRDADSEDVAGGGEGVVLALEALTFQR